MTNEQLPPTAEEETLAEAQEAIDDAKEAAAAVRRPEEDTLIEEGDVPVAGDSEPADGPAPAA
jgi:hypothetical protein